MVAKKLKTGPKLGKTENVQVRLDPHLKWSAELGARVHRQPLSAFIEWCIAYSLPHVISPRGDSAMVVGDATWDPEPADRLMRLAMKYHELLTYPEAQIWKYVKETPAFWQPDGKKGLNLTLVRACWPLLEAIPAGVLPTEQDMQAAMRKARAGPCVTLAIDKGARFSVSLSSPR
jgi:hypothetical protein